MGEFHVEREVAGYPMPDVWGFEPEADLLELCACKGYQEYQGPTCCMRGRGGSGVEEKSSTVEG